MAIPAGLVLLAASAALKYANDQDALRRQGKLMSAMGELQRSRSRESMAATEDMLKKQTPEARSSELSNVTQAREQSLRDTVGAAQAFDSAPTAGKHSSDYQALQEKEASSVAERTRRAIEQLATMGAPGEQRQKQSLRFGKAAGVVDASNAASGNIGRVYRDAIAGTKPDAFADMLASVGMAVGSGMSTETPAAGASAMGADSSGNFNYEDSAGNTQRSAIPYRRQRLNRGFSLWGSQ